MAKFPCFLIGLLFISAAAALANGISLPMTHHHRADNWWEKTRKRDLLAELNNFPPPDVWTVNVSVGTPPQIVAVNVDTGSTDLLIATPTCQKCNTITANRFDALASSTFSLMACRDEECRERCRDCVLERSDSCLFNNTYGDGSFAAGQVCRDLISIGGLAAPSPLSFGLLQDTVPDFYLNARHHSSSSPRSHDIQANVSGIMGLAFPSSSCWGANAVIHHLFDANPSLPRTFSFCLLPDGGSLTLGENLTASPFQYFYTPFSSQVFAGYGTNMFDLRVGGVSLGVSITRLTIVDSGTTLVTLPVSAYNALVNRMNQACSGSACDLFAPTDFFLPASLEDIVLLPSISFVFDGVALTLGPLEYLSPADDNLDLWFFLIVPTTGTPIIGNQVMKYFRTVFDLDNERIGFADAVTACPGGSIWQGTASRLFSAPPAPATAEDLLDLSPAATIHGAYVAFAGTFLLVVGVLTNL